MIRNALTVDVEDWYHHGLGDADADVGGLDKRVERNLARLLDLFDEHRARATFFILGEIAESMPRLVREWDPLESTCRHASLSIL